MTDEQVVDMIKQYYPGEEQEVMQAFQQMKQQLGLSNYETVVMVQKMIQKDMDGLEVQNAPTASPEVPTEPQGRFSHLKGMIRGK